MNTTAVKNELARNQIEMLTVSKKGKSKGGKIPINKKIIELRTEIKKESIDYTNFGHANRWGKVGSTVFPNSKIFKAVNLIAICHNQNVRLNEENLMLYNLSQRTINILSIVLSKADQRTKIA